MPLVKALRSFKGRYGHIRAGSTFNCDPNYMRQLQGKGWIEAAKPEPGSKDKPAPGPGDNRDKGGAPGRAGKGAPGAGKPPASGKGKSSSKGSAGRQGAGRAVTSRSLRQDPHSPAPTPPSSEDGEKSHENQDNPPAE